MITSYAFLVNGKGPAVGGQGYDFSRKASEVSSNVVIENNDIRIIKCWNKEIPGTSVVPSPIVSIIRKRSHLSKRKSSCGEQ